MKQLRSNLKTSDSDLTVDNSVFEVKPTGLKDSEKEIVRKRHTLQKSKYLKPFEYGWKREIVEGLTTRVYYHTPSGEKFRSKRELSTILEGTELTPDNFFFSRRPLGLNNPEKEIIRRSKKQYLNTEKVSESVNDDFLSDDSVSPEPSAEVLPIITDPKYLKPFRYGWKRVVVKGLPKTRKKKAIVYYYRVGGKKIYDKAPLAKILKNRGLTPDHFIFKGVSLGLNDPEKEIIQKFNAELCQTKKRKQINLTDPKFLKPFKYGWKREVVDRSSSGNPDYAFYHSPNGKKVYSKGKLDNILTTNDLTHRNFVFLGQPIGLNDPEKEIIRKIHKVDISVYLKPFQYGWKREIVEGCGKNVFYYTPAGEKILSKKELSTILKGTELTPDNFLFSRRPLGLNDPEKEIIQKSKKRKTTETSYTELPSISNNSAPEGIETKISSKTVLKKRKVSETPELVLDSNDLGLESPDEEVETGSPILLQKSKITKNPKHSNDILPIVTNPKYLKPFRYGWKRVIVTRLPKSWRKKAFVYYYKVGGRKFYKKARLARILKDSELNPDHFIFRGVSLGLNDPEKEKIQVFSGGFYERKEKVIKQTNMTDPKFLKPFEYGWKREVVEKNSKEHAGYAFYYTPKGKRVYSKRGFGNILKNSGLTTRNFVFLGKPIGLNDPEKEIIRKSKKRKMTQTSDSELPSISNNNNSASEGIETKISSKLVDEEGYLKRRKVSETPESVDNDFPLDDSNDLGPESPDEEESMEVETEKPAPMNSVTFTPKTEEPKFGSLQNVSYIYNTLLQVFRYLQSKDLLRAGCVCTMWRDIANHSSLWRTVRIKYERVRSFQKLADCLEKHGTVHLDLRKMLPPSPSEVDGMWREFSEVIEQVRTLRKIELSRCPGWVVEQLALQNKNLEVINVVTTRGESVSLDALSSLKNLKEFQLTSPGDLTLSSDITPIEKSTMLTRLSLTSIKGLNKMNLGVIAVLKRLESLDLGECVDFPKSFAEEILIKLKNLKKLRLEKGQGQCCTIEILVAVKRMPQLEQLELVNFDIKPGFDVALGDCKNIKKLLIIPMYISQTAMINKIALEAVLQLQSTLSHFIWGVTLELLQTTKFFIDDKEDCIPLLKPISLITNKENDVSSSHNSAQLEILPLETFQKLLIKSLPNTKVNILKIPFRATWWQGFIHC